MQPTVATRQASARPPVVSQRVVRLRPDGSAIQCVFSDETSTTISRFLASFIRPSDQLEFDPTAADPMRELRVVQSTPRRPEGTLLCPNRLCDPAQARQARRAFWCVPKSPEAGWGSGSFTFPTNRSRLLLFRQSQARRLRRPDSVRSAARAAYGDARGSPTGSQSAAPELQTEAALKDQIQSVERAFNLLAHPDLRSCYQALLLDPEAPVLFPTAALAPLLAAGELSPDRETFFARKILSFLPDRRERRFRAPLRKVEFYDGYAVYRDSRRKAELILDPISLPLAFDPTWNQWRHLVSTKFGAEATFVKSGKYRFSGGEWHLVDWETALPSRLKITLPRDTQEVLANARNLHHRFGQFFDAIQRIRVRLEQEPIERQELDRICDSLHIPPDFDIAQISWKPDYDWFYFGQLRKRTRKMFLFRDEFIFELERAVVVEIPQQGHATYVFSRPGNLDQWVRDYARTLKDDLRKNRTNAAERLGFLRPGHARAKPEDVAEGSPREGW